MVLTTGSDLGLYRILDTIGKGEWARCTEPTIRASIEKFFFLERAHAEHVLEGLRKAGLTLETGNIRLASLRLVTSARSPVVRGRDEGCWLAIRRAPPSPRAAAFAA